MSALISRPKSAGSASHTPVDAIESVAPPTPSPSIASSEVRAVEGPSSQWPGSSTAIPLGELLRRAGAVVRAGIPNAVWVVAAVSAIKPARGGASLELAEAEVSRAETGLLRSYLPDGVVELLRQRTGVAVAASDLVGMTIVVQVSIALSPRWGLSGRVHALGPGIETSLAKRALEAAIATLRRDGLFDQQRKLPAPRDVTRVAVVHPAGAAGFKDIEGELARWVSAELIATRSIPTPFEGVGAAAGIAAALRRAIEPIAGHRPDIVLLVRGGGAAASLGSLDNEVLAQTIATLPVPLVAGLGHAVDVTLADRVAWRSADTPSKAVAMIRDLIGTPARRAQADYASVLRVVSDGLAREGPRLIATKQGIRVEAMRVVTAASTAIEHSAAAVRASTEATRERLARLVDGLERLADDVATVSPVLVHRTAAELAALMESIRARARRASQGADGGARSLVLVTSRAVALIAVAETELDAIGRDTLACSKAGVERAAAEPAACLAAIRVRVREGLDQADDGARHVTGITSAITAVHHAQEASIARLRHAIETAVARRLDQAASALDREAATLDAADPAAVLARGYVVVTGPSTGRPVTSVEAARKASTLVLTFADGALAVRAINPQPDHLGDPS